MKRFTDAGRKAIEQDNLYCALTLALMLPDICGSLEDPGPGKSQKRYETWFKKWAEPKFTGPPIGRQPPQVFVSAHDCFQIRCSIIHSGQADIAAGKQDILSRFIFFGKDAPHLNWVEGMSFNGAEIPNFLQLNAALFSEALFQSVDDWDAASANAANVQLEKGKLLQIHLSGSTIGGIRFGQ